MFISRLDRARKDATSTPSKSVNPNLHHSATPGKTVNNVPSSSSSSSTRVPVPPRILHDLNEYLFDIFDANCMEEYQIMEAFENKAMEYFLQRARIELENPTPSSVPAYLLDAKADAKVTSSSHVHQQKACKEYGHQEYSLHREFMNLFESLIDKFLQQQDCKAEDLYEELREFHQQRHRYRKEDPLAKYKTAGYSHDSNTTSTTGTTMATNAHINASTDHDDSSSVICVQGDAIRSNVSSNGDVHQDKQNHAHDALEILEVLSFYTEFSTWCEMMMENAKHRIKFSRHFTSSSASPSAQADHK